MQILGYFGWADECTEVPQLAPPDTLEVLGILYCQTQQNLRIALYCWVLWRRNRRKRNTVGRHGGAELGTFNLLLLPPLPHWPCLDCSLGCSDGVSSLARSGGAEFSKKAASTLLLVGVDIFCKAQGGSVSGLGASPLDNGTNVGALALSSNHCAMPLMPLSCTTSVSSTIHVRAWLILFVSNMHLIVVTSLTFN